MSGARSDGLKIALVSVRLGRIQRGFERFFADLFSALRDHLDITLYKGGGVCAAHERVPSLLGPATSLARSLRLRRLTPEEEYKRDCLAFALSLAPELVRRRFDLIHCIDPPLASALSRLQRTFGLRGRLLFTEGCVTPPAYYPRVAHVHHVGQVQLDHAVSSGIPAADMTMVPCGLHAEHFASPGQRAHLRAKHGIGANTFVILTISNLERVFKRVDHIIEEVSQVDGDLLLWVDGHPEDATLIDLAAAKLGKRCRITHVPSAEVPELYGLADVLAHASLAEGFGLAIVEALSSGLMVLTHDSPHFEWLVGEREGLVDMRTPGALAARVRELLSLRDQVAAGSERRAEQVRRRFDWSAVAPEYVKMYLAVADSGFRPRATP